MFLTSFSSDIDGYDNPKVAYVFSQFINVCLSEKDDATVIRTALDMIEVRELPSFTQANIMID